MDKEDKSQPDVMTFREKANRFIGLGSYAMGIVLFGFIGFGIYDDPGSVGREPGPHAVLVGIALTCLAIGYTTGRKRR